MWKTRRRKKLFSQPLPPDWQRIVESHCPYYHRLSGADQRELRGHIQVFMAEKKFEGCGGLALTDEIKLCIAANACILLLHRQTDYYPDLQTILVYPGSYYAPVTRSIGHGVMTEGYQARGGETWPHGSLVVAWGEICKDLAADGRTSVILHEFAHQLDYEDGYADGAPLLGPATVTNSNAYRARKDRYTTWNRVMKSEYERLRARVGAEGQAIAEPQVLRGYGATNPAEFFAVAAESFFGTPREMLALHPELYAELKWYFQQDPAQWSQSLKVTG
jgi:Mlc titration factor MtfA (ptsG expression regulator)